VKFCEAERGYLQSYQIIELQTVETVERIIRPIGRDDREDVELLTILFNVDSAEEGI